MPNGARESNVLVLPGGRLLGYAEYGDPVGTPVLSLHGLPGSRLQSRRYDAPGRRLGIRLIAPDRPGIGLSDPQPEATLRQRTNDVAQLSEALALPRIAVFGASGGALYALACAAWLGERVRAAALGSAWVPPGAMAAADATPATRYPVGSRIWTTVGVWIAAACTGIVPRRSPYLALTVGQTLLAACDRMVVSRPDVRAAAAEDLRAAFAQGAGGVVRDTLAQLECRVLDLGTITSPVLLWHGEVDCVASIESARKLAGRLPQVRATVLPEERHYLMLSRAEEILRELPQAAS